jgi:hypothetical protein
MRGDRVGVGDVVAVQDWAWRSGIASCCVDNGRTISEYQRRMVGGLWLGQRDASGKQCGHGIGFSDGTRFEPWACWFDVDGSVRAVWMRGDRVGVGDIDEMQGSAWGSGDASCGDDGRGAARQYN